MVSNVILAQGQDNSLGPERQFQADCRQLQVAQSELPPRAANLVQHNPEGPAQFVAEKLAMGFVAATNESIAV